MQMPEPECDDDDVGDMMMTMPTNATHGRHAIAHATLVRTTHASQLMMPGDRAHVCVCTLFKYYSFLCASLSLSIYLSLSLPLSQKATNVTTRRTPFFVCRSAVLCCLLFVVLFVKRVAGERSSFQVRHAHTHARTISFRQTPPHKHM